MVDINWPLEEIASDQFQIAGGWGGGTFVGSVGVTLNNLSIKNFFKKGAWRPYPMGQNQRLSISAQTNGTYYKAFAISFTDPWMGGRKPNSFINIFLFFYLLTRFRLTIPMRTTPITPGRKVPVISAPPVSRRDSASVWTGPTRTSRSMRKPATSATC